MGVWFYVIAGAWAFGVILALIGVTRMTYAIEARSGRPLLKNGLPGFANVIPVALNIRVARDAETQAMRRAMVRRLMVILGGFIAFGLFVLITTPAEVPG